MLNTLNLVEANIPQYFIDYKDAKRVAKRLDEIKHPVFEPLVAIDDVLPGESIPLVLLAKANYCGDPITSKEAFITSLDYQLRCELACSWLVEDFYLNTFEEGKSQEELVKLFCKQWLSYTAEVFDLLYEELKSDVFVNDLVKTVSPHMGDLNELRHQYVTNGNQPAGEIEQVRQVGLGSFIENENNETFEDRVDCAPLPVVDIIWNYVHDSITNELNQVAKEFGLKAS